MRQTLAPVISNNEVMPGAHLIWLESPQIANTSRPGQFVMVRCGEDTLLRRPLSVHQRDGGKLALLFAVVGRGTRWLSQRQAGDMVDILGPMGNGFSIAPAARNLLLVAGGIGIAPLYLLAQVALKAGRSVTLLYGTANQNRYPPPLLPPRLELVDITEDGSVGRKGMVTDHLSGFSHRADQVFACGPLGMYKAIASLSKEFPKLKTAQLSLEVVLGCGRGVCYGCTIKTKNGLKQVCQDGPVFDLGEVLWGELSY